MTRRQAIGSLVVIAGATLIGGGTEIFANPHPADATPKTNFSLAGKSAIVTGAARDISRAIAVTLANAGADVLGFDICERVSNDIVYQPATQADLDETSRPVKAQNRKFIGEKDDVQNYSEMKSDTEWTIREFGKVVIFVADVGNPTSLFEKGC